MAAAGLRQRKALAVEDDGRPQAISRQPLIKRLGPDTTAQPFAPSFDLAFRILILVRVVGAMYSSVTSDCDEVFNYYEPLHYLLYGTGYQTWEYSPAYAIRSWAYVLLHAGPSSLAKVLLVNDKRPAFFALRLALAVASTLSECRLYRAIVNHVSPRVGRYFLFFTFASAGMWNASTAFLPSSFALYFVNLATSFQLEPRTSQHRSFYLATSFFAVAAIVGWPFAALLAVPLALEELFTRSQSLVRGLTRLSFAALIGLSTLVPLVTIDSYFYNKLVLVPWNIVRYNVLSNSSTLYGTEPWTFYFINGVLNFNVALPLALVALPMLLVSNAYDAKAIGRRPLAGRNSPTLVFALRLLPFYLWLGVLTSQPHKEERFLFPAYGFLSFNAAMTLFMIRGLFEQMYINFTKAPYKASRSSLFSAYTANVLLVFAVFSFARIGALQVYYRAPMNVAYYFQHLELPRFALAVKPDAYPSYKGVQPDMLEAAMAKAGERFDFEPLRDLDLNICWGKEWYRFPGSFLVPQVVRPLMVQSEFGALIPRPYDSKYGTSIAPPKGFNDRNAPELSNYVPLNTCRYVVDTYWPSRPRPGHNSKEQDLVGSRAWKKVTCFPFIDGDHSPRINRAFYFPLPGWTERNAYGEYCLLKRANMP